MNQTTISSETRRWMMVDDDPDMLRVMRLVVGMFTTAVVECHESPAAALAAFAANPAGYELVITDLEMPEMDGAELCRRLHEIVPEQRVVLVTGSGAFDGLSARRAGFSALLEKPFPMDALHGVLALAGFENERAAAV